MTPQDYLSYFDYLMSTTEHLFLQIPEERTDWKPTENSFSVGQQLAHIVGSLELYARGLVTGEWGFATIRERFLMNRRTPTLTPAEALRTLKENAELFRAQIASLSQTAFAEEEIDTPQLGKVPRWRAALLFIEHHLNHKAELYMCLKLLGVKVNSSHLYGSGHARNLAP